MILREKNESKRKNKFFTKVFVFKKIEFENSSCEMEYVSCVGN